MAAHQFKNRQRVRPLAYKTKQNTNGRLPQRQREEISLRCTKNRRMRKTGSVSGSRRSPCRVRGLALANPDATFSNTGEVACHGPLFRVLHRNSSTARPPVRVRPTPPRFTIGEPVVPPPKSDRRISSRFPVVLMTSDYSHSRAVHSRAKTPYVQTPPLHTDGAELPVSFLLPSLADCGVVFPCQPLRERRKFLMPSPNRDFVFVRFPARAKKFVGRRSVPHRCAAGLRMPQPKGKSRRQFEFARQIPGVWTLRRKKSAGTAPGKVCAGFHSSKNQNTHRWHSPPLPQASRKTRLAGEATSQNSS